MEIGNENVITVISLAAQAVVLMVRSASFWSTYETVAVPAVVGNKKKTTPRLLVCGQTKVMIEVSLVVYAVETVVPLDAM